MKQLTIAVDMDGILVDLLEPWLDVLNIKLRHPISKNDVTHYRMEKIAALSDANCTAEQIMSILHVPDFFYKAPPIAGAIYAMRQLVTLGHHVQIVTAVPTISWFNDSVRKQKRQWLYKQMPFIQDEDIIFAEAEDKHEVKADVFIDDRPDTLMRYASAHPAALVCGIEYPYNRDLNFTPPMMPAGSANRPRLAKDHNNTEKAWDTILDLINQLACYGDVRSA